MDNPLTRNGYVCPICDGVKERGLVACWHCYRTHEMKYGNPTCERIISRFESALAACTAH